MNNDVKQFEHGAVISLGELAALGDGEVAYIRELTSEEAEVMFPSIEGIPSGINLFTLYAADGTPLALTDSLSAALAHAMEDDLEIATVH